MSTCKNESLIRLPESGRIISIGCGNCPACREKKRTELALRLSYDRPYMLDSAFVTMTYTDDNLIYNYVDEKTGIVYELPSVTPKEFSDFMKRLRKYLAYDSKVNQLFYVGSGEYGDSDKRPHYHSIIYLMPRMSCPRNHIGVWLPNPRAPNTCKMSLKDAFFKAWTKHDLTQLNQKKVFEEVFGVGGTKYVAKHQIKRCEGSSMQAPFFMRRSKGIGSGFFLNDSEVQFALENGYLLFNGLKCPIPRYYQNVIGKVYNEFDLVKFYSEKIEKWRIKNRVDFEKYKRKYPTKDYDDYIKYTCFMALKQYAWQFAFSDIMYDENRND